MDYFLFTVMAFNSSEPRLTEVKYQRVDGLMFPSSRRYAPSDWEGAVAGDANWIGALSENFKLNNGFDKTIFQPPGK